MATRELTEGGQSQPGPRAIEGEAGQPQPLLPRAHHRHRMQVAAEVQTAGPGLRLMAQPPRPQRLFVLDGEQKPVGVLTRGDVVRALAAAG